MKRKNPGLPLIVISIAILSGQFIFNNKKEWNTPHYIMVGCCLVLMALGIYANWKAKPLKK